MASSLVVLKVHGMFSNCREVLSNLSNESCSGVSNWILRSSLSPGRTYGKSSPRLEVRAAEEAFDKLVENDKVAEVEDMHERGFQEEKKTMRPIVVAIQKGEQITSTVELHG